MRCIAINTADFKSLENTCIYAHLMPILNTEGNKKVLQVLKIIFSKSKMAK